MEPNQLKNQPITSLTPMDLNCRPEQCEKIENLEKSDLRFRAIEWLKRRHDAVRIVWLVLNRVDDIASFNLVIKNRDKSLVLEATLDYNSREFVAEGLDDQEEYQVCVTAIDSSFNKRYLYKSQCSWFDGSTSSFSVEESKVQRIHKRLDATSEKTSSSSSARHKTYTNSFVQYLIFITLSRFLFL